MEEGREVLHMINAKPEVWHKTVISNLYSQRLHRYISLIADAIMNNNL
jgi:hypothetical protein